MRPALSAPFSRRMKSRVSGCSSALEVIVFSGVRLRPEPESAGVESGRVHQQQVLFLRCEKLVGEPLQQRQLVGVQCELVQQAAGAFPVPLRLRAPGLPLLQSVIDDQEGNEEQQQGGEDHDFKKRAFKSTCHGVEKER